MSSLLNLSPDETNLLVDLCIMSGDFSGFKDAPEKEKLIFYAVSFPDVWSSDIAAQDLIFTSKKDALEALKKYSGARFKQFTSYEEAVEYSSKPLPNIEVQAFVEEKSCFKSISSQEMVSLRKTIETGDEVSFLDKVWSNPRYLINCNGDGPTVLQEGTRYNALHVAARFKKANMCLLILNTLHDVGFISGLYPKENPPKLRERIKRLVDLYLNTPDKSLSETPLHFACKWGADGVLSILLSFPECDVNKRNKYGVLAREMVCDRFNASPGLKEKMLLMFEDLFYIPVLRDVANNILEPVIGEPCRSTVVLQATSSSFSSCSDQKKTLRYCAFAGPMSQNSADKFYTVFSKKKFEEHLSYTPEQKKQLVDICRSDSEKGLERVGRKLAKTFGTSWIEFWPKLMFWGDMSSNEGLEFLESHLKSQNENADVSPSALDLEARCDNFSILITNFVEEFVRKLPQLLNNKNKMTFFVLFQSLLPYTFCMSKFSFSDEDQLFLIHHEIGHLLYLKLIENSSESFDAIKLYINTQFINMYNFLNNSPFKESNQWKMFLCILKYACYCQSSNILALKPPSCDCNWIIEKSSYNYSSSMCYSSILRLKQSYFRQRVGDSLCTSEKISEICTVSPDSLNSKEKPSIALENDLKFDKKFEGSESEEDKFEVAEESFSEYCDISNIFVATVDKFCLTFSSIIIELSDSVPFTSPETFFTVFQEAMPFFKPLCQFNFSQNCIPDFYHNEIALTILEKIRNSSFDILVKWRNYFISTDILYFKSCDLHKFKIADTREYLHLLCVIKHIFILNFHLIKADDSEIKQEESKSFCKCEFELDCEHLSINPHHCLNWLKSLQNSYKLNLLDLAPLQLLSLSSDEEDEEEKNAEVFYTPPESPVPFKKEIFIDGSDFTDLDIDVLRAIVDDKVSISRVKYPNVYHWKTLMESKLGSLLNPEDKLSCTPASSSASVRRAVTPLQRARRTLF